MFAYCLASVTVGMADGALETFVDQMKVRTGAYDGAKATEDPFVRQRLAKAEALVRGLHEHMDATSPRWTLPSPRASRSPCV